MAQMHRRRVDTAWGGMLQRHISWRGINNVTVPGKNVAVVLRRVKRTTVCKTGKAIILPCLALDSSQLQHSHAAGSVVFQGRQPGSRAAARTKGYKSCRKKGREQDGPSLLKQGREDSSEID